MSKIIVFVEGKAVTGYEVVNEAHVEAARLGLSGADAVVYERAVKAVGADVMATITGKLALKTADEALTDIATMRGKAFILVDRLPDSGEYKDWEVKGGKVVLKAA